MICGVNTIVGYNKRRVKRPPSRRNLRRSRATSDPRAEAAGNFRQCCRGKIRVEPVANQQFGNKSVESDSGHVAADWRRFESGCWRDNQSGSQKDFARQIARSINAPSVDDFGICHFFWCCLLIFANRFSQSPLCASGSASVPQSFFTISRCGTNGHFDFGFLCASSS